VRRRYYYYERCGSNECVCNDIDASMCAKRNIDEAMILIRSDIDDTKRVCAKYYCPRSDIIDTSVW
jgi:hypothetical protein